MPRKSKRQNRIGNQMKCAVPDCTHGWMVASSRRLAYCELHYEDSLKLYAEYKMWTSKGLDEFDDESLMHAIRLRREYTENFTRKNRYGEYHLAHVKFVELLEKLLTFSQDIRGEKVKVLLEEFNDTYIG